jgi:hypothetical protein
MKGGKAIAAGSDGCVFDGTFDPDGTFKQETSKVTKVYAPQYSAVAANEYARMQEIEAATGGVGVVVASQSPVTIAKIADEAWENDSIKGFGACKTIAQSPGPYTGLVLPRITGDFLALKRLGKVPVPGESFEAMYTAIDKMHAANLVHMDLAARNVFYTEENGKLTALLGDFGATINLNSPDFDAQIQTYVTRYRLRNKFLSSIKVDGLDPVAVAMMILYDMLLQGKGTYDRFLDEAVDKGYFQKVSIIAENTWVVKYLVAHSDTNSEVFEFIEDMANEYRKILTLFATPKRTYEDLLAMKDGIAKTLKYRLSKSDGKLFNLFVAAHIFPTIDEPTCVVLRNVWFGTVKSSPTTGGRRVRGGNQAPMLEFETLEDALAVPDLILPSVAGRRKTHRKKRGRRVKMSRRR